MSARRNQNAGWKSVTTNTNNNVPVNDATLPSASYAVPKSTRGSSTRILRSSSAFQSLNQTMRNLSVDATTELIKHTRSQSTRSRPRDRVICSAVPDSAELTPRCRPDKGGSKGDSIRIYANHFRVDIDDAVVYQYDIDIVMVGRDKQLHPPRKNDRWDVLQSIIKQKKDFPVVWYDEGKTLYSREMLSDLKIPLQINLQRDNETKIFLLNKLDLVRQDRIKNIFDFINRETSIRPRDTVRIIETLFKQRARNEMICVRNQFYDRNRQLTDLGDGRGMAKGYYQALFLTHCGPTLNINLTFTCFYMPLSFVDFACKHLGYDITRDLQERDLHALEKIISNLLIDTTHTGRRIFYRFQGFGRPANQLMFPCGEEDKESTNISAPQQISVANYFAKKYRKLLFPHLPCINAKKGNQNKPNWLPMEFVKIVEWQRVIKPLDKAQRGAVSKNTIIKPEQRYNEIMTIVRNNQFDRDPYLKELNIHVHQKEMLELQGRVLTPPDIKYRARGGREVIEHIDCGKWRIRNWLYTTPQLNSWGMIYFGNKPDRKIQSTLEEFCNQLPHLLRRNGFVIKTDPSLIIKSSHEDNIRETLFNASREGWQLAIIILNSYNSDALYNHVKSYANRRIGLMTQCVNYQALERNIRKLDMYVENISQKINGKLGGINGVINLKAALSRPSREDLFMFIGADVTHSTCSSDRPSIAAVVGSRDLTNTSYVARLCEQYPKAGRCSVEIIKELDTMVTDLLRVFADSCGNRLPNKIIFYRDGVDDGQYQKVLDNEVKKIKDACRIVYANNKLPDITFIIVKKRHNTRFFLYENNQTLNIPAGTVIDTDIVHPSQFDFYLCSQAAVMGTSRPTLYHVLHDDNDFSSDDIQQLTYWLCHTDMRCTKSVSIPAPVHYAHLAAYASRALKYGEDADKESLDDNNEEPESYSLDDIKTQLMILDDKVADDMWFL